MTKHFCDICGRELPWQQMTRVSVTPPQGAEGGCTREVCPDCVPKITKLFHNSDALEPSFHAPPWEMSF